MASIHSYSRSPGVLSGYGCEGLRPRPSQLSGTAGELCGVQPARAVPAGTGALSWIGSCSEVLPAPLYQVLVLGWCLFLGRGTQDSLEVEDPLAEAEKRPWDSVRDGRGGMSGREASEQGRPVRQGGSVVRVPRAQDARGSREGCRGTWGGKLLRRAGFRWGSLREPVP